MTSRIGTSLPPELRSDLVTFLRLNSEEGLAHVRGLHKSQPDYTNLSAMFTILKQYRMWHNPTKCAFGVASGKFLGFMISQRGIEANLGNIQAILDMTIPKTVKDIQSLTGHVAALTKFISKATDRCAPFFKALQGSKRSITGTAECD
ncbi:unnamed protein product [Prunus armeniaca]